MSRIKGKNTKPEILVRKLLHSQGYRFTLHGKYQGKILPGKPDIVLPKYKTLVFVHGCYWHGHEGCKYFKIPETRTEWWTAKINRNKELDRQHQTELEEMGWKVLIVWQCRLKEYAYRDELIKLFTVKVKK